MGNVYLNFPQAGEGRFYALLQRQFGRKTLFNHANPVNFQQEVRDKKIIEVERKVHQYKLG